MIYYIYFHKIKNNKINLIFQKKQVVIEIHMIIKLYKILYNTKTKIKYMIDKKIKKR